MHPRGWAPVIVNPDEFRENAMQSWAAIVKQPKKKNQNKKSKANNQKQTQRASQPAQSSQQNETATQNNTIDTEELQSQISTITANTHAAFRLEMKNMNERIDVINKRAIANEEHIN